ncbi:hypothetical protein K466DRAFT_668661 [Polyporus arcularius HHB13444]|uniref:Uncharacterized protein n=1 Tax=Polyporus arcularius HHB13444 TaxID=1314778 RepID=A0A5C3NN10_9APHY|nr:hypothetical protein K466DRAFT_668661 [Polyporus arcularius HHB13444]
MKHQVVPDLILQLEVQLKNWFEEAVFPEMDERVLRRLEYRLGKSNIAKDVEKIIYPGLKQRLLKDLEHTQQRPPSVRGSDRASSVGSDNTHTGKRRRQAVELEVADV